MEVEETGSNVERGYQEESMDDDTPSVSLSEPFRDEPRAIVTSGGGASSAQFCFGSFLLYFKKYPN